MSSNEEEIGRTILEYKKQRETLACLLSKLQRIGTKVDEVKQTLAEKPAMTAQVASRAAQYLKEGDVVSLFEAIAEASQRQSDLRDTLNRQGVGDMFSEGG